MTIREADIVYEGLRAWVFDDRKRDCYTVFLVGITHSTSDSSYPRSDDGLSIAKARADHFNRRPQ